MKKEVNRRLATCRDIFVPSAKHNNSSRDTRIDVWPPGNKAPPNQLNKAPDGVMFITYDMLGSGTNGAQMAAKSERQRSRCDLSLLCRRCLMHMACLVPTIACAQVFDDVTICAEHDGSTIRTTWLALSPLAGTGMCASGFWQARWHCKQLRLPLLTKRRLQEREQCHDERCGWRGYQGQAHCTWCSLPASHRLAQRVLRGSGCFSVLTLPQFA